MRDSARFAYLPRAEKESGFRIAITGLWLPIPLNRSASVATDWRVIWGVAKGRKSMDKSCQVYGNFHTGNHGTNCGTLGLYRSLCQGKDIKTRLTANDVKRGSRR